MQLVNTISDLRTLVSQAKKAGKNVGFVPTMGNLHEGHLSLIDVANQHADFVVSSIFVNPMQFGQNEDLDAYPRTMAEDQAALEARNCDVLFAPTVKEMYPNGLDIETKVEVPDLGDFHCGASRPGHFIGVSTVVTKLFNMVQPDIAVFGQKDYQQLAIIRKMTRDLCLPIDIIGMPTSREDSGLARSSRNGYLSDAEKKTASRIFEVLTETQSKILSGQCDYRLLEEEGKSKLASSGFTPDYFNIANSDTLTPAEANDSKVVILVAALLGSTRLIDNLEVETNS